MTEEKRFAVRCRAIILHEGKLLVVRHPHDTSYAALPGGNLEWGEDPHTCIVRELVEELGVSPEVGRLLYVHTYVDRFGAQSIEFFFEVKNGADYLGCGERERSHAHELASLEWIAPADGVTLKPEALATDFAAGTLLSDVTRILSRSA